jgi:hypothetical protein
VGPPHGNRHTGNGRGVAGDSDSGPGVYGKSTTGLGLYGQTTSGAQGVFGRTELTARASQGVAGEGLNGTGVLGNGRFGVVGSSKGTGYGGQFQGGKAQLKLVPKRGAGAPTGTHTKGDIHGHDGDAVHLRGQQLHRPSQVEEGYDDRRLRGVHTRFEGPGSSSPGPSRFPYSPKCVEGLFSEVRNIKGFRESAYSTAKAYFVCGPCRLPARQLPC